MSRTDVDTTEMTRTEVLHYLLQDRHSCRAFRPEPVEREVIEQILTLAGRTPSWCNTQPWHVHLLGGAAVEAFRSGLRDAVTTQPQQPDRPIPTAYAGVYRERRKDCALLLYRCVGIADGDRAASSAQTMANFDLFGAPHVAIITTEADLGVYGAVDCGLYVQTFLLAARSLGVATVPQAALAGCAPYVRDFLDVPEDRNIVCGISFGYADEEHPANAFRTPRADLTESVTWQMEANR
jgi:nitroreductase